MELSKYQTIIAQTAVFPKSVDQFDLAYGYMGLMDEWIEWINELELFDLHNKVPNVIKEHGDWLWYMTSLCVFLDIPLENVFRSIDRPKSLDEISFINRINKELLGYNGRVKKFYRDSKPIDKVQFIYIMQLMYSYGEHVADRIGYSIPEVLQVNYDKLIKRRETNTIHGDGDHRESELQS